VLGIGLSTTQTNSGKNTTETNTIHPTTTKVSKRRKLTAEEKVEKRKLQTRSASKIYRQRRKALETQLSEKLEELENEKKLLISERRQAEDTLKKVKEENEKLRRQQKVYSEDTAKKRLALLKQLEVQVNEGADDATLCETINNIKSCCSNCMSLGQCNLESIISPSAVQRLVMAGFFENTIKPDLVAKKGSIEDLVVKLKTEIKSLTNEQRSRIDRIADDHKEKMKILLQEREELTNNISVNFGNIQTKKDLTLLSPTEKTSQDYVEIIGSLEHLRKSLKDEASEWELTLKKMVEDTLTPLQVAQFLLRVEFQHASVRQLNNIWSALNKTTVPNTTLN